MNRYCPKCKTNKPKEKFHKDNKRADGLQLWCADCNRISKVEQYRKSSEITYAVARRTILKSIYGLSVEEFEAMLETQKGVCAICSMPEKQKSNPNGRVDSLRVDHDHETGKVRGLLCTRCNFGISQFKDNPELAIKAAFYLMGKMPMLLDINQNPQRQELIYKYDKIPHESLKGKARIKKKENI